MRITLMKDPSCVFVGDETITLIEAKLDGKSIVLAAIKDAAADLANYGVNGSSVEVEPDLPPVAMEASVYQAVREYRWDWGLTPDCKMLFAKSIKRVVD
jgi:hypothetical protein